MKKSSHFAHMAGLCDLQLAEGSIVTCGSDGFVKIWEVNDSTTVNDELKSHTITDFEGGDAKPLSKIALKDDKLVVVSADSNRVDLLEYPSCKLSSSLIRYDLPITSVSLSSTGEFVAIAAETNEVKIVEIANNQNVACLRGHEHAILCLRWSPISLVLVSVSRDGTLRAWQQDGTVLSTIKVEKDMKNADICWSNDGKLLAVTSGAFKSDGRIIAVTFSENGLYVASDDENGLICVWEVTTGLCISNVSLGSDVASLKWIPKCSTLCALTPSDGQLWLLFNTIPADYPACHGIVKQVKSRNRIVDSDDESEGEEVDGDRLKGLLDDEAMEEEKEDLKELVEDVNVEEVALDEPIKVEYPPVEYEPVIQYEPTIQCAFQPGSTPIGKKRRYLVWNSIAAVVSRVENTHSSIEIDFTDKSKHRSIRLTDNFGFTMAAVDDNGVFLASENVMGEPANVFYRPFHAWAVNSEWGVTLKSNDEPVAVATGHGWCALVTKKRRVRVFSADGGMQLGVFKLPSDAVSACGYRSQLCVVYRGGASVGSVLVNATRVCEPQELPEAQYETDLKGDSALSYWMIEVPNGPQIGLTSPFPKLKRTGDVSLTPGSSLEWIGYSNIGVLSCADSTGCVQQLLPQTGYMWTEVVDVREALHRAKREESGCWILGIVDEVIVVVGTHNDGDGLYPSVLPRPIPFTLPLTAPLLATDYRVQDEKIMAMNMAISLKQTEESSAVLELQVQLDKLLMEAIVSALEADKPGLAHDLAKRLRFDKALTIVKALCRKYSQPVLENKVNDIMAYRARREEEEEESSDDDVEVVSPVRVVKKRKKIEEVVVEEEGEEVEKEEEEEEEEEEVEEEEEKMEEVEEEEEPRVSYRSPSTPVKRQKVHSANPFAKARIEDDQEVFDDSPMVGIDKIAQKSSTVVLPSRDVEIPSPTVRRTPKGKKGKVVKTPKKRGKSASRSIASFFGK